MNSDSNINPLESTQDPTEEILNNPISTDSHSSNEQDQTAQTSTEQQESQENEQETDVNAAVPAAEDQIFENSTRQVENSQQTEARSLVSFAGRNTVIAEERSEGHEENNDEQDAESHQDDAMTFRTMGSQNFIQFNHLSQDRSCISNSQGVAFWDDNNFDSRQSSQMFDRSQSFRLQKGPPELLHSDSNFMFGPRYKTKAYDPTVSPIKKSARKELPNFGRDLMGSLDDHSEQRYDQEEKDRRKSMSRLSLSSNKQKKRFTRESTLEEVYESQHELGNPFMNEVSFNCNNIISSQKDDDVSEAGNQTYPSSQQDIGRPRRLDSALLNDDTPLQSQEMKISRMFEPVIPQGEDCETIMEPSCGAGNGNQQPAEVNNNWSVLTEAGDYSVMTTDGFMLKSTNLEKDILNGGNDGKVSESKKSHTYRSPLSTKAKSIPGTGKKSVKSVSVSKFDKENIDPMQVNMEIECPRFGDKLSQEKLSPSSEEETAKSGSDTMVEENNNNTGGGSQEPEVPPFDYEPSNKKLSYMERKLRAIEAENYKIMGAFDFKKSYSKLEKEKMEKEQEQRTQNLFQSVRKPTAKENEDHSSSFMTDTKKHYSRIQLEKLASKESIQENSNTLSGRLPFQMIQSEADRDAMLSQESLLHKSVIFTPANEKKRKYDLISTSDECPGSVVEGNTSLKRVKITDENHVESFEEMLAKSKKKIPRIQLEKELCKEREKAQKEQELKELQAHSKDTVFKVEMPLLFKKEENGKRQSNGVV